MNTEETKNIDQSKNQDIYNSDFLTKSSDINIEEFKNLVTKVFPPQKWVVEGLVPKGGITCLAGKPKSYKSYLALNMALRLAKGEKYLGQFEVEKSKVLYISKEDTDDLIQTRILQMTDDRDLPIKFCFDERVFLDSQKLTKVIVDRIKEEGVDVVIFDSFRRMFHGDENSSQVVSEVHNQIKKIQRLCSGITMIFIHHYGKDGQFERANSEKIRGSSDILAMVDSLIAIDNQEGTIYISQPALRSRKAQKPFSIKVGDGDDFVNFDFQGFDESPKNKEQYARELVLASLNDSPEKNRQEIITETTDVSSGVGRTTVANAIKWLEKSGQIQRVQKGKNVAYKLANG